MICLWKNSGSDSCSCAYRLQGTAEDILDHLAVFRSGTIILRQQGLSVSHIASFGSGRVRDGVWHDERSHLQSLVGTRRIFHLITDAADPRPMLTSSEPGSPADLSIRLDGCSWQAHAVRRMIHRFDGKPVGCEQSRLLGAGAWLDEWEPEHCSSSEHILAHVAHRELESCPWLEVVVRTPTHRSSVRFRPVFIDIDGSVLRVADRHCRHVMFADAESPAFRLVRSPDRGVYIHRELPAA